MSCVAGVRRLSDTDGDHMRIVNIEKLSGCRVVVLTGRSEHVRAVAKHMKARLYHCPRIDDYFMDYPSVIEELHEVLNSDCGVLIVTTQSAEFLDCLLASEIEFVFATVRKFEQDDGDVYRLRVLSKEEAWENRLTFKMELRV